MDGLISREHYRPWHDDTGVTVAQGFNNYWTKKFGAATSPCIRQSLDPVTPTAGRSYTFNACWAAEWRADDLWQANSFGCINTQRGGELADETSGLSLTGGASGAVGAGKQHLAMRVLFGRTAGISGERTWNPATEVGIIMALAYAPNGFTSRIGHSAWKHDEWDELPWIEHCTLGLTGPREFLYAPFVSTPTRLAGCLSALSAATVPLALTECNSNTLLYGADPAGYNQAQDFPLGTTACHQPCMTGMGTSTRTIKIWHNEQLIVHISGWDGTIMRNQFYDKVSLNNYANANQGCGERLTFHTTYRYQHNMHITKGPPVPCPQIAFPTGGAGKDTTPPAAPTNLRVQ